MRSGEAGLGDLRVVWRLPAELDATGGVEFLPPPSADSARRADWVIERGEVGPRPPRFAAFYGDVRLVVGDVVRVWSPGADLRVDEAGVTGVARDGAGLASSIALHALAATAGLVHVHAALVRIGSTVVLAPGGSGAGKTSFALAVASSGGELLADDAVYVDALRRAVPVRRPPHVTETTLRAHPGAEVLGPVEDGALPKLRVKPPTAERARVARVDAIVVPTLDRDGPTRVVAIRGVDAFPVLLGSSAIAVVDGAPRREELVDVLASLAHLPAFRLLAGPDALEDPGAITRALGNASVFSR